MANHTKICAYADCFSGVSGDMFLAALIDAGLPFDVLQSELAKIAIAGYELLISDKTECGIQAKKLHVQVGSQQPHRAWQDIKKCIEQSKLSPDIKDNSLKIFSTLAEAEAAIHGCPVEEVHFHETGNVDAIVDIVGAAIGLSFLNIDKLICSPLPMPRGFVTCAHGKLPVPAPAVCKILADVPVYGVDYDLEMVTPTGASIIKALSDGFGPFPSMILHKTGYGAGSHILPDNQPNCLRLVLGIIQKASESQTVEVIETNLDDWSPEGFPFLYNRLFDKGALDVSLVPIQMKKGRPGFLLQVISSPAHAWELKNIILTETTAIGLRYRQESRWTLPREMGTIDTQWGPLQVKKVETPAGTVLYPEYEDCRRIAEQNNIPLKEVYAQVGRCSPEQFRKEKLLNSNTPIKGKA